ncbi:MAG TPA: carbamoyltransferase N-terminal domain-containing protein, partial [Acidobacteriota bacterium]|nr:carbamoyltransferase N-terminal domain-containing protein [Acidobacteriota bacterium]
LSEAQLHVADLDYVGFYDKPLLKFDRLLETYLDYAPSGFSSFLKALPLWMKEKLWMPDLIRTELAKADGEEDERAAKKIGKKFQWRLLFGDHHESHAASAFYPSPFEEAAILTIDGVGEWATSSIGIGKGNELTLLKELRFPDSLGLLYSAFTYYTGFRVNSGEYKVMGLAPYGEPKYVSLIKDKLVEIRDDGSLRMNHEYFGYAQGLRMTNGAFEKLLGGVPRKPESAITQKEMDLARSIQVITEEVMLKMTKHAYKETGMKKLCMAGGVSLNCVANGRILREVPFEDIWIQPAAGDAGGALGIALAIWHRYLAKPRVSPEAAGTWQSSRETANWRNRYSTSGKGQNKAVSNGLTLYADSMKGSYLGPRHTEEEIEESLQSRRLPYKKYPRRELPALVADLLAAGKIVGLHQGRMEFGPRALGGRSILGDPRSAEMQSTMNLKIKYRESFRPFAPSVLRENVADWFELDTDSPYMLLVAGVAESQRRKMTDDEHGLWGIEKLNVKRSEIPAVTHVDYSARIQTVRRESNPLYWEIIHAFGRKTGCPVIINTSFNVRGEPIVCTPEDSYRCFMRTEMDFLVLETCVLDKRKQPTFAETINWKRQFKLD